MLFLLFFIKDYLTIIRVAGAQPKSKSQIEYFGDAIMIFVPFLTASFTYSNLALAPLEPALDVPSQ